MNQLTDNLIIAKKTCTDACLDNTSKSLPADRKNCYLLSVINKLPVYTNQYCDIAEIEKMIFQKATKALHYISDFLSIPRTHCWLEWGRLDEMIEAKVKMLHQPRIIIIP